MTNSLLELEYAAGVLKLLGDTTRLTMIKLLDRHACCVCEFTAMFRMSQPAISQHLRKLKDAGLVGEARKGQWIIYSLNKQSIYYPLVRNILEYFPDQDYKLKELEKQGLRISCE